MNFEEQYVAKRAELWQRIVTKATEDEAFRASLLENPKPALEREFDIAIPMDADIKVIEETPDTQYIVLPPKVALGQGELSEDELESVAGGWHVQLLFSAICFGSGDPADCGAPDISIM